MFHDIGGSATGSAPHGVSEPTRGTIASGLRALLVREADGAVSTHDAMLEVKRCLALNCPINRGGNIRSIGFGNVGEQPGPVGLRRVRAGQKAPTVKFLHLSPVGAHPVQNVIAGFRQKSESSFAVA